MSSPKEIAEKLLKSTYYYGIEVEKLARAYLDLEKEITKLKKSREVLRKACEFYGAEENLIGSIAGPTSPWDYSKVDLDRGKKAREAIKADDEVMVVGNE